MDEPVEHVDATGRTIRVVDRAVARLERLRYRTVLVAVLNDEDQILIHQRAWTKATMAGMWDLAVGGGVTAGEPPAVAAARELAEEVGIAGVPLTERCAGPWAGLPGSFFAHVFVTKWNGELTFTDEEVIDARYVTMHELDGLVASGVMCPDSVDLVLPRVRAIVDGTV